MALVITLVRPQGISHLLFVLAATRFVLLTKIKRTAVGRKMATGVRRAGRTVRLVYTTT